MSKIEKLIEKYCPNGVEYKELWEIVEFKKWQNLIKNNIIEWDVPVIAGWQKPISFHNTYNRTWETITVSSSWAYSWFVNYWNIPLYLTDSFSIKPLNDNILTKYIFYFLKVHQQKIYSLQKWVGVPHIYASDISNFSIPVPRLEVQEEIVKILDKFTQLEAELEAELEARKKQYEYYREKLLDFGKTENSLERIFGFKNFWKVDVVWEEIWKILKKSKWTKITASQMKDLHDTNWKIKVFAWWKTFAMVNENDLPSKDIIDKPSIIVKSRGIIEFEYYDKLFSHKNEFWSYYNENKFIQLKYVFYYLNLKQAHFQRIANRMQMPQISLPDTEKFKIPIPYKNWKPYLELQQKIVDILDRFDSLVNDMSIWLPAEIKYRKQQYEYYREKLLTFKKLEK